MNRRLKEQLKQYYEAPAPERKREFLNRIRAPKQRIGAMLLVQLRYIPLSAWMLSLALFALILSAGRMLPAYYAGCTYALVPFLSVTTVSVSMRSCRCRMAELESTTLFSLGSVIMMRMLLLGIGNLIMLVVLTCFMEPEFFWAEFLYILAPYLLAGSGSLMIYRRYAQRDANYMCLAFSGLVAVLELWASRGTAFMYEERYAGVWALACMLLLALFLVQVRKTMQAMEEMVWN